MKYIIALAATLALTMSPVYASDASNAPVKKGNLMLAKKKDHSKAESKETKKPAKKSSNKK